MKIVHIKTIASCGPYSISHHWQRTRADLHEAIRSCCWPPGSKMFTIFPDSGKKRGQGNGVRPIKFEFVKRLKSAGWAIEGAAKSKLDQRVGNFDAVLTGPSGPIVAEWETGNISSSHRSMNKLTMLVADLVIGAGTLVIPSRRLYRFLTDRIGNYPELEPYLPLWKAVPCKSGVLEIVVIEQDAESRRVRRIPKGSDGRAQG